MQFLAWDMYNIGEKWYNTILYIDPQAHSMVESTLIRELKLVTIFHMNEEYGNGEQCSLYIGPGIYKK